MKKCLICWVTCTSCRGWKCRCWMTWAQVVLCNELLLENQIPITDYRASRIADLLVGWEDVDSIRIKLREWLEEELQAPYIKTAIRRSDWVTNWDRCKYEWVWVWAKCIKCWVARRDKQHDLSKKCEWNYIIK